MAARMDFYGLSPEDMNRRDNDYEAKLSEEDKAREGRNRVRGIALPAVFFEVTTSQTTSRKLLAS